MRNTFYLICFIFSNGLIFSPGTSYAQTFTNSGTITINSTSVLPTPATPYPTSINVSGLTGVILDINISLHGFSHAWPSDVDILLVGPNGQTATILSDVGGDDNVSTSVSNLNITLDDQAPNPLTANGTLVSGTFRPTNIGIQDGFPSPAPAAPGNSRLWMFNNTNPNGTWRLYIADDFTGDIGSISGGWSLNLLVGTSPCTLSFSPAVLPNGINGTAYNQIISASGSTGSYSYLLSSGILPPGITLAGNGTLSGTPTVQGTYNFTISAISSVSGCVGSKNYDIIIYGPSLITDYYRTRVSGNWNSISTWESSSDNINWRQATLTPDFNSNIITVLNTHTLTVTANVTVDQLVIDPGSAVVVNTGVVFTVR